MRDGFEKVYTVTRYDDGPRSGIADYDGIPHLFLSLLDETDGVYDPRMVLSPVADPVFQYALEDWEIWRRWQAAYHAGRVTREGAPALPEDRVRSDELKALLDVELVPDPRLWFCARGVFRTVGRSVAGQGLPPLKVAWLRTGDAVPAERIGRSPRSRPPLNN